LVDDPPLQTENVRKMLLAFSRDLRVVMLRLASRLQTLRLSRGQQDRAATQHGARIAAGVRAAGQPAGHLAGQVGDGGPGLPLPGARHLPPGRQAAGRKAREREAYVEQLRQRLEAELRPGHRATVQGRPKHIYSIVCAKMRGKSLDFDQVFDVCGRCVWWCPREGLLRRAELGA
jgi:GTP pyrophosphokinase